MLAIVMALRYFLLISSVPQAYSRSIHPSLYLSQRKSTVISFAEAADKSTVTAFELTDSAPLEAVTLKSTVGALSLSVMV